MVCGRSWFKLSLNIPVVAWSQFNEEEVLQLHRGCFSGKSLLYRTRRDVNYIRRFIRQDRPGTFSANLWSTCAKLWLWMQAQKLDSNPSPFSNQFSKVDILHNSKKWKAFGMKRLSYRTRRYHNEYSTISKWGSFYLQFELIGFKANKPWLAHMDISVSNLPSTSLKGTVSVYF